LGFPFLLFVRQSPALRESRPFFYGPSDRCSNWARGRITVSFDREREEVRLNPALEGMLGPEADGSLLDGADDIRGRSALRSTDVMDVFGVFLSVESRSLGSLPSRSATVPAGAGHIHAPQPCFTQTFSGQALQRTCELSRDAAD